MAEADTGEAPFVEGESGASGRDAARAGAVPSRSRLWAAWGVHLFTASGAFVGAIALLRIGSGDFRAAALLMIVALTIDAVDGTLARRVGVHEVLPHVDGRRLDDMVDYFNFVVVPAVFMVSAGSLPGWGWAALPIIASSYGFSQEDAKTPDHFFLGWPSYWNVVAIYLWLLDFGVTASILWVAVLSLAIFVPLKYVYPSRLPNPFFRHTLNGGGLVWAAVLSVAILWPERAADWRLAELSLSYLVYYMVLSVWLGDWKSGWA